MDLCVVIPARNEERFIGEQLEALISQEWDGDWEIAVVDNGSTDGTAGVVGQYAARVANLRLVPALERADKAYAIERAAATTDATAIAVCDADDIVMHGWVAAMGNALRRHCVVTGPNELDELNPPWLAGSRGRSIEEPLGSFAGIFPCIRGNNFGVQADVFAKIGPLREALYPVEDVEFSLRCWLSGIDIVGVSDARVHYRYRSSARDLWRQGWRYGSHRPQIARLLRDAGKPHPRRFGGWKSWVMLIVTFPGVVTRPGRARWLWIAGNRLGQVVGSIRYRALML
jgi:glycosyltransferase involved in cell wall biosynthesis